MCTYQFTSMYVYVFMYVTMSIHLRLFVQEYKRNLGQCVPTNLLVCMYMCLYM